MKKDWKPIKQITFKNCRCNVVRGFYSNNRTSLQLYDSQNGMPITTATVNIPDYVIKDDQVIIKSNNGLDKQLIEEGFIGPVIGEIINGNHYVTLHKLLYI
tara:strand:- start:1749 stop:2051 length:303 start_codon:yes stop_codon:yes gene_type:complete